MATEGRQSPAILIDRLFAEPGRFSFFQAVRLLEWEGLRRTADARQQPTLPVGEDHDPRREAVRLVAAGGLAFPPNEIASVKEREGGPPVMAVSFLGLTGPSGVLPQHYTETLLVAHRDKKTALRAFLDIFNHRTLSHFYRAWRKYRLPVGYEQAVARGWPGDDPISRALLALVGLGTPHLRERMGVPDATILHYAGHFAHGTRPAGVLEDIVADLFGLPVSVIQFRGRWLTLAEDDRTRLPDAGTPDGAFCQLGVDSIAGLRTWDIQNGFRIRLGTLGYGDFCAFLPGAPQARLLAELVRLYVGPSLDYDVQVRLRRDDVPRLQLGAEGPGAARLGWNTWLRHDAPPPADVDDAVFRLDGQ